MEKKKYLIYIDESGIHKTTNYSSFVLVYVLVENKNLLENDLIEIEKSFNISNFHWSDFSTKHGWGIRQGFIKKTKKLSFNFKYSLLKNPINSKNELNNTLFLLLNENNVQEVNIDGKQPKWFERQIKKNLRDRGVSIHKIRMVDDRSEPIIRLADAIANVVRIYHDSPRNIIKELFSSLSSKIIK